MKLRLPHKFQAALVAALASVSFTTLSSGSTAQASTATELNTALGELITLNNYVAGDDYTFSYTLTTVGTSNTGTILTLASGYYFNTQQGTYGGLSTTSGGVSGVWPVPTEYSGSGLNVWKTENNQLTGWISRDKNGTGTSAVTLSGSTITVKYSAATNTTTFELYHANKQTTDRVIMTGVALGADGLSFGNWTNAGTDLVFRAGKDYVWHGSEGNATWDATTSNTNWLDGENAVPWTSTGNAMFTTSAAVKTVTIGGSVTARNMVVQDNYTFTMGGNTVAVTAGMTVASGKTLTLDGAGTLTAGLITGGGNITKTGSGTLTLNTTATLGTLSVQAGALSITESSNVKAGGISFGNGSTVTLAAGSVLDLSGYSSDANAIRNIMGNVKGAGTVKINGAGERSFAANQATTLLTNLEFISSAEFNGTGWQNPAGHTFNVGNGTDATGGIKVTNDLRLESQMHINVKAGSSLTVGGNLIMGHSQAGNPGHVDVNSGTLSVGHIQFQDDTTQNTITLADSTVEATQAGNLFASTGNASTVTATNVTLKATNVDWAWNRAIAFGGTLAVEAGTHTITLGAAGANFSVGKAIELTSGTVAFAGNWELGAIEHTGTTTYTGGAVEGTNGFAKLATELQLVNVETGASIGSTANAHFTIDGVTATLDANGLAKTSGEVDYGTFHVITGSETVSQGRKDSHNPVYSLADNTTLVVDADLTNAQIAREAGATGTATLTGASTITLSGTGSLGTGIVLHSTDWAGTVKVTGTADNLNMTNLGTANSKIVLDGWTGYFNGSPTIASDVEIGSGGASITNGGSSNTITFAGDLTGSGNIKRTNNNNVNINLAFTGDVSKYTGSILFDRCHDSYSLNVTFSGSANEINAALKNDVTAAGTFNVTFAAADTVVNSIISRNTTSQYTQNKLNVTVNANTTFNETVTADKVQIASGASATFNKAVSLKGDLTLDGSATLVEGGSVNVIDLSHSGKAHGTLTLNAGQTLTYGGSFWAANNNRLILEEGATVTKASEAPIEIVGLANGGYVSSSTNGELLLNNGNFTLHNVQATVNTDSDDVQLHFDNSKFVTSHTVTLKNLESVFSGMEIGGGTTTVGSGVAADSTVTLGEVTLSGGNLTLAEHVTGSVNGMNVTASGTVTAGKLVMGDIITMGAADATLTLSDNMVVDITGLTPEPGSRTEYVDGDNDGNGFASMVASVRLVDFTEGGTVSPGTGVTYVSGSNHGTLVLDGDNKGLVEFNETSYTALYVNTPNTTEMLVNAQEKAISKGGVLTEVYLNAGTLDTTDAEMLFGTLHVNSGEGTVYVTGDTASITSLDGKGMLSVGSGTNLNGTNLNIAAGDTLTLTGGATITYNNITNRGTLGIGENTRLSTGAITVSGDTFTTTGAGTLVSSGTLTVDGGTVNLGSNAQFSAIDLGNGTLNISAGTTTVDGNVTLGYGNGKASGTLTVGNGATLTAQNVSSPWGYSTLTVAGTINATNQFSITTGNQERTVTGSGTINTGKLVVGNLTTKAVFSGGLAINIGNGGIGGDSNGTRPLELHDVTLGVLGDSTGWSAANAITLADTTTGTTFNIGEDQAVTLNGAVSGSGKLIKDGAGTLELTSVNNYGGTIAVNAGELLITTGSLPNTLTVTGVGELHMRSAQGSGSMNVGLISVTATNLHLDRDDNHNSRFHYNSDSSNLTGVQNLYFDGGQLWLDGKDMTGNKAFTGAVTFNETTYSETNVFGGAAIRVGGNGTFSGPVVVNADTKLAWQGDKTLEFSGSVTGSGNLNLVSYSGNGTFKVSGDASGYTGAVSSVTNVALNVTDVGQMNLGTGSNLAGNVQLDGKMTVSGDSTISGAINGTGSLEVKEDATLNYNRTAETTVAAQLSGEGTLQYTGTGTTKFTGDVSNFTGSVDVKAGTLNIMNIAQATSLNVKDVTIAANATMGVYNGTTATAETASEGTLTMKGGNTLKAGNNATLNANLVMESDSVLDVSATNGGLLMGSSVTLKPGVTLSSGDMTAITDLGFMDQYTLFTGVDAFSYDGTTPSATPIAFDSETWVKASQVFSNSEFTGGKDYYVFYSGAQNGSNVGAVYVMQLPEPTTGTLSLLALCALAARRRRKQ